MSIPERFTERVCVVVSEGDIAEDEVRQALGDTLPLRIVHWQDHDYLATVRSLRPRVIVLAARSAEQAQASALLLALLLARYAPTVASVALPPEGEPDHTLTVCQLGYGAAVCISSLDGILFLE